MGREQTIRYRVTSEGEVLASCWTREDAKEFIEARVAAGYVELDIDGNALTRFEIVAVEDPGWSLC